MQKFSLQSLSPQQAGGQMSFENGVSIDSNGENRKGMNQTNLVESNLDPNQNLMDSSNLNRISLNALPADSLNKSLKLDDCLRLPSANKVGSALAINSSLSDQPFGHLANQQHFFIGACNSSTANFLKIDRHLLQHSPSVGLLIVNQADANKLMQQTHSLSLTDKPANALSSHSCPNSSNGSPFLNDRSVSYTSLDNGSTGQRLSGHIDSRTTGPIDGSSQPTQLFVANPQFHLTGTVSPANDHTRNAPASSSYPDCEQYSQMSVNQNANQLLNETSIRVGQSVSQVSSIQLNETDGQSMSFLEPCLSGGPFSIHPVKCY